ncbi:ferredoxin-NADP reductase [Paraburkholderia sp. GAS199]|uniref:PDR/VanB family oxidoreductase n=1 Tax=Paraburkholderia sp. GAS199 TaxID=3035126 RepID=UPI003D1EE9DE
MNATSFKVRVDAVHDEALDIRSYKISRIDGQPFDAYEAGAHIDVTTPAGTTRQYSLCSDPRHCEARLFAVKKELTSRGGSRSLHEDVKVGTELTVSAPRNLFRLVQHASETILIGAGIGITPLLSMAHHLVAQGAPFTLHYFVRSKEHAAFIDLLTLPPFAAHVRLHIGVVREGLDDELTACMEGVQAGAQVYTCGPPQFMARVTTVASRYVPEESVHLERFGADVAQDSASNETLDTFEVELSQSGRRVKIESHQSIVDALAAVGVQIDTSCGEGVCGTCMIDVVSGEPDHRDHCLSKAERAANDVICCCVSRSKSPVLVLDL